MLGIPLNHAFFLNYTNRELSKHIDEVATRVSHPFPTTLWVLNIKFSSWGLYVCD